MPQPPEPELPVSDFDAPMMVPNLAVTATPSTTTISFTRLPAVRVYNLNNHDEAWVRLYDVNGELDDDALATLDRILGDVSKPDAPLYTSMDARVVQLMFRAAYHFRAREIVVISGYRAQRTRREGFHARGLAIDFQLPNVRLPALAAYLQTTPRAGVGLYTHPRTQWIHLDSRTRSHHWADSSGPGAPGGAWKIGDTSQRARQDRKYDPSMDWPEGTLVAPAVVERRQCRFVSTPQEADEP